MLILVSTLHLFSALAWPPALAMIVTGRASAGRIARTAGPIRFVTGLLRALGAAQFSPGKALIGAYGGVVLLSVALLVLAIVLAQRSARSPSANAHRLALVATVAALCLLMKVMVHWPMGG